MATDQFKGVPGEFVFANGDPSGFGYHGDFIAAWKDDTLEKAVKQCNDQVISGLMQDCPVFEMEGSQQCRLESPLPAAIASENVMGPMQGLANGLQVAYGPAPAPQPGETAPVSAAKQVQGNQVPAQTQRSKLSLHDSFTVSTTMKSVPSKTIEASPIIQEKIIEQPSNPTLAPTISKSSLHLNAGERILTTSAYVTGKQLHEVVEIAIDVTLTASVPPSSPTIQNKRDEHVRRHSHHRHMKRALGKGHI